MSKLGVPGGDDHPDAATKHLADAQMLLGAGRPDGAAYLAGYVVECALKAIILLGTGPGGSPKNHDLRGLSTKAASLAALPTSRTARYVPTFGPSNTISSGWRETLRYLGEGNIALETATTWVQEADSVYHSTVAKMRLDGVV